jgi:hypothetical protein
MNLNAARVIVLLADNCSDPGRYDIPASVVYREGWEALGADYWWHEGNQLIAGPSLGDPTRTMVALEKVGMVEGVEAYRWKSQG